MDKQRRIEDYRLSRNQQKMARLYEKVHGVVIIFSTKNGNKVLDPETITIL